MAKSRVNDYNIEAKPTEPGSDKKTNKSDLHQAEADLSKYYKEQPAADLKLLMKQAKHRRWWLYFTSFLVVVLAGIVVYMFAWSGAGPKFGQEDVTIELQGPAQAPSGQDVEYTINYNNNQSVGLQLLEFNLRYPDGFTFKESNWQATNDDKTRFAINKVSPYESGSLKIKGQILGQVGDKKTMGALVVYEPDNIKAQYNKNIDFTTELIASVVNLEMTGPTQAAIGQDLTWQLTYKNSSENTMSGLVLKLDLPQGFQLTVPKLQPVADGINTWQLSDLTSKQEVKMDVNGKFTDTSLPGEQTLSASIGLMTGTPKVFTVQEQKEIKISLIKSAMVVNLTANDLTLKSTADLGEELVYQLDYVNDTDSNLSNLKIVAQYNNSLPDFATLKDDNGGSFDSSNHTITWTKQNTPALQLLPAKGKGTLRWRVRAPSVLPTGSKTSLSFACQVKIEAEQTQGDSMVVVSGDSNEVLTKINSSLLLQVEGRYYTDELVKLGSGPLPPRVGSTTTYVIFWRLGNTFNDVENIEVTTTLPQGVIWTGQSSVSAGEGLTYNQNTREVRWLLNRLPAGAGSSFTKPEASFEVAIRPEDNDADKILVLTKTTTATARDAYSGGDLIVTAKFITTDLDQDLGAQGKGVVTR